MSRDSAQDAFNVYYLRARINRQPRRNSESLRDLQRAMELAEKNSAGPAPSSKEKGVWTLSRGFLVSGARRVVASNWVVDDEAVANLVSYFCSGVAKCQKTGRRGPLSARGSIHRMRGSRDAILKIAT